MGKDRETEKLTGAGKYRKLEELAEITTPVSYTHLENKIGKLERYFSPDTEVQVTMSVEKGRQKIEVTIPVKGSIIRAEQDSNDMYVSIDLVEEIIERQIKKYKTKLIDKKQSALSFSEAFLQEEPEHEETIKIVKTKRFAMKPMDPEEACICLLYTSMSIFYTSSP